MQSKKVEIWVGLFVLIALAAITFLCLKVADIKAMGNQPTYRVYASFGNIGGLKERSPVKIGGVVIGRVSSITLKEESEGNYRPEVELDILNIYQHIPDSSSLSIRTSGLLGEQFLALNLGFYDEELGSDFLKDGGRIENTHSAMVLEDLIGQFLYKTGDGDGSVKSESEPTTQHPTLP
ncbi:MAG TPA: outer membrane lipid asymmetry maintenance protein MlaD [Proteus sp.]|uniref:Periplasmic component of an ABC superfamily transporter n=1 Tax=Proteus hauseri ATCC 700826 TaxID=1354271 RepID=A0AAJ3HU01_PROHU|nr:outer membrane lipid asymmetry maintenance protein MlaD [Proteus hauseri]OAT48945.1 periplasmic component of an ABC superfamily transporter [Proteus hauseri ATCC 700826]QAV23593.1 outer membrane lipid asymmetry maintenance protein MlaD [Proteus hauseri]HCH51659.1 outer membrane lipid asymmetry maintenance protein MlaD [Proteus sp. (in: enterobacteria)]